MSRGREGKKRDSSPSILALEKKNVSFPQKERGPRHQGKENYYYPAAGGRGDLSPPPKGGHKK